MLFAGGQGAATMMREPDDAIVQRLLHDLHELYPQTRGVIAGATVRRWRRGNVYAAPAGAAYRRRWRACLARARDLWARLWPLCQFLEGQSYAAAVKTGRRLVGDTTGPVRAPLLLLDDATTSELVALLEHATHAEAGRG